MKTNNNYFKEEDRIECPYCNNKYISLLRHVPYKHGISMEQFRKEFPNHKVQLGIKKEGTHRECEELLHNYYSKYLNNDGQYYCSRCNKTFKRLSGLQTHLIKTHKESILTKKDILAEEEFNKDPHTCNICNRSFKNLRGLSVHQRTIHKDIFTESKRQIRLAENNKLKKGFECPICHNYYCNLSDHVRCIHNIEWDDFCIQYNWKDGRACFSEEHRKNLSKNKKAFYQTSRGKELRNKQSMLNTVSSIDDSCQLKTCLDAAAAANRGYSFHWIDKSTSKYTCARSFEEYVCRFYLDYYNIDYEYEPRYILYQINGVTKRYIPDIKIGNTFYEIKCTYEEFYNEEKYRCVEKSLKGSVYNLKGLRSSDCATVFKKKRLSLIFIKNKLKETFFNDESFFVSGRFLSDYKRGQQSSLLKNIFGEDYTIFETENLKRIREYETNKYKSN